MTDDELTAQDFAIHDLPRRPVKYEPDYRAECRRLAVIYVAAIALVIGLSLGAM